jgi:hypothetical protein
MPQPNANTFVFQSKYGRYFENIHGNAPRTIRLVRVDGDQLVGTCLGREYTVNARDYQEILRRAF